MKNIKHCFLLTFAVLVSAVTSEKKTICHESSDYLIVEGSTGEVGTHFLVKYKSGRNQPLACEYVIEPDDLEIRNEWAEYFLSLMGDLLILDSGTGPDPRGLIIWDLKKRKKVYTGTYSEEVKIDTEYMEFWLETGDANDENCPEGKEWKAGGLGAAIETWVRLNFSDFKIIKSSKTRCSPRQ
jgi:hypothetical protein